MKVNLSQMILDAERQMVVKKTPEQIAKEVNTREMARYDEIIRSIAGKYGRDWCLTFDDVYSELCFKVLKLGVNNGWEALNESFVARICYNRAVDLYRSARRKYERTVQESAILAEGSNEDTHSKIGTVEEAEGNLLYSEFVDRYNPESRERKYLVVKMVSEGLIGQRYAIELGFEVRPGDQIRDYQICTMLGLHPRSKSFERMKKALKEELVDFLHTSL